MNLLPALCLTAIVLFITLILIIGLALMRMSEILSEVEREYEAKAWAEWSVNHDQTS